MQYENDLCRDERASSADVLTSRRAARTTLRLLLVTLAGLCALSGCAGRSSAGPEMPMQHGHGAHETAHDGKAMAPCPMHAEHGEHCPMHQLPDGGVSAEHPQGHGPEHMMADGGTMPGHRQGGDAP